MDIRKGLSNSHACIPLAFIRLHSSKFSGVMEIVDYTGLNQAFGFHLDWNTAAILQFYTTCFFYNRDLNWMTGDAHYTASFSQFVQAPGFHSFRYWIHS